MGYDIEKEKREAIEAGRKALNSLSAAKENLNSAKNWGLVEHVVVVGVGCFPAVHSLHTRRRSVLALVERHEVGCFAHQVDGTARHALEEDTGEESFPFGIQ